MLVCALCGMRCIPHDLTRRLLYFVACAMSVDHDAGHQTSIGLRDFVSNGAKVGLKFHHSNGSLVAENVIEAVGTRHHVPQSTRVAMNNATHTTENAHKLRGHHQATWDAADHRQQGT